MGRLMSATDECINAEAPSIRSISDSSGGGYGVIYLSLRSLTDRVSDFRLINEHVGKNLARSVWFGIKCDKPNVDQCMYDFYF